MAEDVKIERLQELLEELGVRTVDDRTPGEGAGYPLSLTLEDGSPLTLDLPKPAFLGSLDPEGVGVAILDRQGRARKTWGLAKRIKHFKAGESVIDSPLADLLDGGYHENNGALYLEGYRYYSAGIPAGGREAFVLVTNAQEERQARRQASRNGRMASALKRLGKALTMNQNLEPLCVAAAHEIASVGELAAVLLWTYEPETKTLRLAASVGTNRQGSGALNVLSTTGTPGCAAEMVAIDQRRFELGNVMEHVLTSNLEAKFCYLKPEGLSVHPLVISDRLLGVLELVGREGDVHFYENGELFETFAEHLALALNSANMFENFERLAHHDAHTGLANHRHLHEFLDQRFTEAERTGQELGLIMLDVDHFRSFNEEEGHDAGDDVLRLVAEALKLCVRPYDLAARYGGEEFTVVMPGSSIHSTIVVAERIRAKVEAVPYVTRSGRERHVTVSLGCAVYPVSAPDPSTLLKAADVALYEAKRAGRNRAVPYEGQYMPLHRVDRDPLEMVIQWVGPEGPEEAFARLERLEPELESLATSLGLSASQRAILRALVWVVPAYREARSGGDGDANSVRLAAMESAEEFRVLLPSLQALDARFDGRSAGPSGVKIPLLARILAVVLALDEESGRPFLDDPDRFDPEIVSLLRRESRAA